MLLSQTQFHQLDLETSRLPMIGDSATDTAVAVTDYAAMNNERSKRDQLKLLKLYYNKDAAESVTKSLLMLHDDLEMKLNESSSLSSASSASIANSKYVSELQRHQQNQVSIASFESNNSNTVKAAAHSCLLFLSDLVEKQEATSTALPIDDQGEKDKTSQVVTSQTLLQPHLDRLFKANYTLKTLRNKSSSYLAKRFSLKARSSNALDSAQKSQLPQIVSYCPLIKGPQHPNQAKRVDQLTKGHSQLSNSSSSNSNVSSSNLSTLSSQVQYNPQPTQTLKESFLKGECEGKNSDDTRYQLDYFDAVSKMSFYVNSKQQQQQQYQPASYNNNNFYNQNQLLPKKLRKLLPNSLGLRNHGNTCFMNCILQCLFHTSPLADFFITEQFEQDMQVIAHQQKTESLSSGPHFVLTKHFYRLLNSMWRNTYESNYSHEFKQVVGHFNSTFSGGNQNDSHELCVWLLDRLSQELSLKLPTRLSESVPSSRPTKAPNGSQSPPTITSSFVEELFQIEFKSTVICSQCSYQSSKYENDMMLSLPLPQNQVRDTKPVTVQRRRHSLYPHLILSNQASIRGILSESTPTDLSKSKFYVSPSPHSVPSAEAAGVYSTPFHVKIGCNIHISTSSDQYVSDPTNDLLEGFSLTNPSIGDFKEYISSCYQLRASSLVFFNLSHIEKRLNDEHMIQDSFFKSAASAKSESLVDSMCIVELSSIASSSCVAGSARTELPQLPLINIIGFNVYYDSDRLVFHGLPFVLVINRDCSYSELCQKLLEAQSKYFKDKHGMLKYKDLVEKLFTLSLSSDSLQLQQRKLNAADELPLYAECVEQALNDCQSQTHTAQRPTEYIKLHIEWKSFDGISNLFKVMDYSKADFVHKSVHHLHKFDSEQAASQSTAPTSPSSASAAASSRYNATNVTTATLDDCFELFTEQEHLTDENSWQCPRCQKATSAYKNLTISQAPPILIIHLKRFFYKSKTSNFKLTTPVWFPVNSLDITKHIDRASRLKQDDEYDSSDTEDNISYNGLDTTDAVNENYLYDLVGVANHKGANMANGHYTAFCKNLVDTKWYCFDDATCTPMVEPGTAQNSIFNNGSGAVWTENAYILFYKKRNCMRNERWWTSYVDRGLYEYDDFDRFLHNLDQIEMEQKRNQESLQAQQLHAHRHSVQAHIVSKDNLNSVTTAKKPTGLNKIRSMLSTGNSSSHNGPSRQRVTAGDDNASYCSISGSSSRHGSSQSQQDLVRIEVRHYDEMTKPNRLLKQTNQRRESQASPAMTASSAGPSTPTHILNQQVIPLPLASNATNQCNLLNAITDLPSSDSNNSLDHSSSFVYSRKEPSHTSSKNNCFKAANTEQLEKLQYERNSEDLTRLSNESSQSALYRYPSDNDYNFRPTASNRHSDSKKPTSHSKSIHEYQPRHHQPLPSTYLTTSDIYNPQSPVSSNRSSSTGSNLHSSPKSLSDSRTNHASRYINSSSIETPI